MRIFGYVLSVVGILIVAVTIVVGGYNLLEPFFSPDGRPGDFFALSIGVMVLAIAFGIGLRIIGKHLSGWGGVLFPRIRAYVTSGPAVVAAMIGAVGLWGIGAWFTAHLVNRVITTPYHDLALDFLLGIPFGVLIPIAAGFALFAATRIPAVPADGSAPPPHDAVHLLGSAFVAFGIFWLLFAGSCTITNGFNASGGTLSDPDMIKNALLSLVFGGTALAVGVWLRRIASVSPAS